MATAANITNATTATAMPMTAVVVMPLAAVVLAPAVELVLDEDEVAADPFPDDTGPFAVDTGPVGDAVVLMSAVPANVDDGGVP